MTEKEESLEEKVVRFHETFDCLKSFKLFQEIVEKSLESKASTSHAFTAANQFFLKEMSIYRTRMLASAASRLDILSKIVLLRGAPDHPIFPTNLSVEAVLSSPPRCPLHSECRVYRKSRLRKPLAYGMNKWGKLGVGSEEQFVGTFEEIQLPNTIADVYMSACHSIFVMTNGDVYGVGRAENFLSNGTTGNLSMPVKLDYIKIEPDDVPNSPHCHLTNTNTTFFNYKPKFDLIVGDPVDYAQIREQGPNWILIEAVGQKSTTSGDTDIWLYSILRKEICQYHIRSDGSWLSVPCSGDFRKIVFIVCGRRVSFPRPIWIRKNGEVFAHFNGTLYRGKLKTGFRKTDSEATYSDDDEVEFTRDEGLVAFMSEMVLPFAVERYFVNKYDSSLVFYPHPKKRQSVCPVVSKFRAIEHPNWAPIGSCHLLKNYKPVFASDLAARFADFLKTRSEDLMSIVYSTRHPTLPKHLCHRDDFHTGLPKAGVRMIRALLTLQHFVRNRSETNLSEVLLSLDSLNAADFQLRLQEELEKSVQEGRKIKVLVAATVEEGEARRKEVIQKANDYYKQITKNIMHSLKCLVHLPLQYRRDERDTRFCYAVRLLMNEVEDGLTDITEKAPVCTFERLSISQGSDFVKEAIDRLRNGDIDRKDPRFETIRVEAIPVHYTLDEKHITEIKSYYISTTSTEFFINLINKKLLDFVEDGVLNLNNACIDDPKRFGVVFEAFFGFPVTIENFDDRPKVFYDNDTVCSWLPASAKYTVYTLDDQKIEIPSHLFQLFSDGFDEDSKLKIDSSAMGVKYLAETLMDIPSFFQLAMKDKKEVFNLADQLRLHHLTPHLLKMIVMTAKEENYHFIKALFNRFPDIMIRNVGEHRPDIVLHWRRLPFDTSNFEVLSKIADLIQQNHYVRRMPKDAPITLSADEAVDDEPIDKQWLVEELSDEKEDADIKWCLIKSIQHWDGFVKRWKLKRLYHWTPTYDSPLKILSPPVFPCN